MAIISKTQFHIEGAPKYQKVVSCDSAGEFKIVLPEVVTEITGNKVVTGPDLKTVEDAFRVQIKIWREASTSSRKVIMFECARRGSFDKGVSMNLAADVFEEVTIRSGGEERKTFKDVKGNPLKKTMIRNGTHDWAWGGRGVTVQIIDWTEEREEFFVRLAAGFQKVKDAINELNQPDGLDLIDGVRLVVGGFMPRELPAPTEP